jgi:hypothetical protein
MCRHSELKLIATDRLNDMKKIIDAEQEVGRTFFPPDYINSKHIATAQEVADRLTQPNQTELFTIPKGQCKSIYNICE